MEEVSTTDPKVILRNKGRSRFSRNLLTRTSDHDTLRSLTVLILHQIKTVQRELKIQRIVCITNTTGEDYGCRMNPDY